MTPCFHPSSQDQPAPNKAGWRVRFLLWIASPVLAVVSIVLTMFTPWDGEVEL